MPKRVLTIVLADYALQSNQIGDNLILVLYIIYARSKIIKKYYIVNSNEE